MDMGGEVKMRGKVWSEEFGIGSFYFRKARML
jgi:hypothetical protein